MLAQSLSWNKATCKVVTTAVQRYWVPYWPTRYRGCMFGETPLIMIEDPESLNALAKTLSAAKVIGIDTESDSFYSYQEKVCLIQISDLHADYIVDPLRVSDLSPLAPTLADPSIVKILHGADYDVVCLKRDFDFHIRGMFDTLIAAQMLGMPRIGLADLIQRFFGHEIDKQYQRHDWSRRPLFPEHLDYARGDTHFLLALRELMTRKLKDAGRMRHMREECALQERREWVARPFDPDGYLRIKKSETLDDTGKRILKRLYHYRDDTAKSLNRPVFKVIPDQVLVQVAHGKPTSLEALDRLFSSKSAMKRRHGSALVKAVVAGSADTFKIPRARTAKKKPKGPRPRLTGRAAERALQELKAWRNKLIASKKLTPFTVASNGTLKSIASQRPRTLEELTAVSEVRAWQVHDFGHDILDVLDHVDPPEKTSRPT
jgi:ribonuclease D